MPEAGVNTTARMIAAAQLLAAAEGWQPRPSPAALHWSRELLRVQGDRLLLGSVDHPLGRAAWRLLEAPLAPGLMRHFLRRKAWIEERCREAIARGCRQLLVLGAGLDTLAVRLRAAHDNLAVVELDRSPVAALREHCFAAPGHRILAGDLAQAARGGATWTAIMAATDPTATTLIVCEGVAMYLPLPLVTALLGRLATRFTDATLVISVMEHARDPVGFRPYREAVTRWLRLRGEPFRWGLRPGTAAALLQRCHWRLDQVACERDLARTWPGRRLDGESLLLATAVGAPA